MKKYLTKHMTPLPGPPQFDTAAAPSFDQPFDSASLYDEAGTLIHQGPMGDFAYMVPYPRSAHGVSSFVLGEPRGRVTLVLKFSPSALPATALFAAFADLD